MKNPLLPISDYKFRYRDMAPWVVLFVFVLGFLFIGHRMVASMLRIETEVLNEIASSPNHGVVTKYITKEERAKILKRIEARKNKNRGKNEVKNKRK